MPAYVPTGFVAGFVLGVLLAYIVSWAGTTEYFAAPVAPVAPKQNTTPSAAAATQASVKCPIFSTKTGKCECPRGTRFSSVNGKCM